MLARHWFLRLLNLLQESQRFLFDPSFERKAVYHRQVIERTRATPVGTANELSNAPVVKHRIVYISHVSSF